MTDSVLVPLVDVASMIKRAADEYRHRQEVEEAKARGAKPPPCPLPTKEEAWSAWCYAKLDGEEALDRDEFERWWRGDA